MLEKTKIIVESTAMIEETEVAVFRAVLTGDEEPSFYPTIKDKETYKEYRGEIRANRDEFEDYVFQIHEQIKK